MWSLSNHKIIERGDHKFETKMKDQELINTFVKKNAEQGFKRDVNVIKLSKANTYEHNFQVCKICCKLLKERIPFYTEFRMKTGVRPDIVTPTMPVKFIEVLHTETEKEFSDKKLFKYPPGDNILIIDSDDEFKVKLIQ